MEEPVNVFLVIVDVDKVKSDDFFAWSKVEIIEDKTVDDQRIALSTGHPPMVTTAVG